ncbi:UNVERIFIED_CONTAM: Alpha carbonic anhydrase 7 [Sesamum radiatum]|uniref:Alpha carbonic anhydrase 7 n=1 Tax=Sesamum radiatum TaxID=300843 RepID=A0AAW2W396_SESRA
MKLMRSFSQSSFIVLVLMLSFACFTRAQEVDDEREFSYEEDSEIGPGNWGNIRPEWGECNSGRLQSPIDLLNERVEEVSHLGRFKRNYRPSNATLINRGHDMMLRWTNDAGHIQINGTLYHLRQCHWHSPSEHTINGKRCDRNHVQIGRLDSFLSMLKRDFEAIVETRDVERTVGVVNPKLVEWGSRKYYRYMGSLTVPPCTQNIIWTMMKKVRTVTREQVELIREAVHDESEMNARPIQPIHERRINLYRPKDREN